MKKSISISKTAHYYIHQPELPAKKVLFVIHGYAQLAADFIEEFKFLKSSNTLVVAPEGLSMFYNKQRKPVANWMTSEHRRDEIKDYINYLKDLEQIIFDEYMIKEKYTLGFSQGVSTLFRWLIQSEYETSQVFACSGSIPPEITLNEAHVLKTCKINYYYGDNDGLMSPDKALTQIKFLDSLSLKVNAIPYSGKHELSSETINDLKRLSQTD